MKHVYGTRLCSGAAGYQVRTAGGGSVDTEHPQASIHNLLPGDVYTFVIVAVGTRGRFSDVTSDSVTQQTGDCLSQLLTRA